MNVDHQLVLSNAGHPGRQFRMSAHRASDGTFVVEVTKSGRLGSSSVAIRDAAVEPPVWTVSGDAIRFADDDWIPEDRENAIAWMDALGAHVAASATPPPPTSKRDAFLEDFGPSARRWQYATVNAAMFTTHQRLAEVLGQSGRLGWELVQVYDKSSSWWSGTDKGFMLLRREVPPGVEPIAWSVQISSSGSA